MASRWASVPVWGKYHLSAIRGPAPDGVASYTAPWLPSPMSRLSTTRWWEPGSATTEPSAIVTAVPPTHPSPPGYPRRAAGPRPPRMAERPGSLLARRPLHFFVVADCSGSMASDGKMQALNTALREMIPHLVDIAGQNPHARVLVRVMAFATGARWHLAEPTPVEEIVWQDLKASGYTDLGAALTLLAAELHVPPMEERALPPAIVLISDGLPTDDFEAGLARLLAEPWGARAVRMAVGIGRDADHDALQRFIGPGGIGPVTANNPEQLVRLIRWASTHAGRVASTLTPAGRDGGAIDLLDVPVSETVW